MADTDALAASPHFDIKASKLACLCCAGWAICEYSTWCFRWCLLGPIVWICSTIWGFINIFFPCTFCIPAVMFLVGAWVWAIFLFFFAWVPFPGHWVWGIVPTFFYIAWQIFNICLGRYTKNEELGKAEGGGDEIAVNDVMLPVVTTNMMDTLEVQAVTEDEVIEV